MSIKLKRTVLISMSALSLLGLATMAPTTTATAKKHVEPGKVIRTMKYKTMKVKAKKGYVYKNTKLTKRGVHLTKYKGKVLSTNKAYLIKVPGKPAMWYDRVTSSDKKLNGYVYNNYLKVYTVQAQMSGNPGKPAKSAKNNVVPKDPDANVPLSKLKGKDSNPGDLRAGTDDQPYYDTDKFEKYRDDLTVTAQDMIKLINEEREKRGLRPYEVDSDLTTLAQRRSSDSAKINDLQHCDASGQTIVIKYAKQANMPHLQLAECLGYAFNAPALMMARDSIFHYIYQDADSSWGHRDGLLNSQYTHIGIGVSILNSSTTTNAIVMY